MFLPCSSLVLVSKFRSRGNSAVGKKRDLWSTNLCRGDHPLSLVEAYIHHQGLIPGEGRCPASSPFSEKERNYLNSNQKSCHPQIQFMYTLYLSTEQPTTEQLTTEQTTTEQTYN